MYLAHCFNLAKVKVKRRTIDPLFCIRIVQNGDGIFRVVAVVVEDYNLCFYPRLFKLRSQVVLYEVGLF